MKIPTNNIVSPHLHLVRDTGVAAPDAKSSDAGSPSVEPQPAATRKDSVQLSLAGRALAKVDPSVERKALTSERITELRQKVLDGAYNSLEAVEALAQKILEKGDL